MSIRAISILLSFLCCCGLLDLCECGRAFSSDDYTGSNDTLTLRFAGLKDGLTPGDPTRSDGFGSFVLDYYLEDVTPTESKGTIKYLLR